MALHIFTEDIYVGKTQPTDTSKIWVETTGIKVNLFTQPNLQGLTFNSNIKEQLLAAGINIQEKLLQGWQIEETNFNIKQYNTITQQWEVIGNSSGEERLEGDGAEFYTLAPTALSFRSTAPLNELQEVQINGVTVDPANYTLEEGSTIVTFPIEYLKTLNVGSYEVAVASDSKTVKGDFTVAAPELNEHGFYYNQPYTAYVAMFGENESFFIRNDGTMDIVGTPSGQISPATYSVSGNNITVTSAVAGTLTGVISTDGTEIFCNELQTAFKLGNTSIVSDEDYIYIYKEDLGGYEVTAIDKTKAEYGAIKTGINGVDTVKLADRMFKKNSNIAGTFKIPDGVTHIGAEAFSMCWYLEKVEIPNSVISIGTEAFYSANMNIKFNGTIAEWSDISKDDGWNKSYPKDYVQCSDGQGAC